MEVACSYSSAPVINEAKFYSLRFVTTTFFLPSLEIVRKDRGVHVWNRDGVCINLKYRERDGLHNREFKQQRRQRQRKGHLKINIWEMATIL